MRRRKVVMKDDTNAKKTREEYLYLIPELKKWLGEKGIAFFKEKGVGGIWWEGGAPHIVHFHEGMQARNKLRDLTNNSWTTYEYDNTWCEIIEECIC